MTEAATPLYAVLAVGPGWDWPTLIGLYPNIDVYTGQLQALQAYTKANPQSSSSRFVLAYHYATQGHEEAAASQLKQVVALKPNDALSTQLLAHLQPGAQTPAGATAAQPPSAPPESAAAAANTKVPEGATILGAWTAHPNADTSIAMTIEDGGKFHWKVDAKGQNRQFNGTSSFGGGILTLVPEKRCRPSSVMWLGPMPTTSHSTPSATHPNRPLAFSK